MDHQLNPAARSAQMDYDALPACLQQEITVKVAAGEHKGRRQYLAEQRYEGYKLVIDISRRLRTSIEEGETWVIRPERAIGTVVFCYPQKKLLTAAGEHPMVAQLKYYAERHCGVTISSFPRSYGGGETQKTLTGIAAMEVAEREVIRLTFIDGSTYDLYYFAGKSMNYGRFSGDACRRDDKRIHVTFWEK